MRQPGVEYGYAVEQVEHQGQTGGVDRQIAGQALGAAGPCQAVGAKSPSAVGGGLGCQHPLVDPDQQLRRIDVAGPRQAGQREAEVGLDRERRQGHQGKAGHLSSPAPGAV